MQSAYRGQMEISIALLQKAADPFKVDKLGKKAIDHARINNPKSGVHDMLEQYMQAFLA